MNPLELSAHRAAPGVLPDVRGQAVVEFALVGPIFIAIMCAIMEFSGIMFAQTLLEGGAREASRYGVTGRTPDGVTRDEQILNIIESHAHGIIDIAELEMETLVYESFENIGQPEPFTDEDGNGQYDEGEPYTDVNGNSEWDDDMGAAGLGGPGDVVVYRLAYDWPVMVPLFEPFFGETVTLRANIAVRNEPFPET
jgi:hypothetical protein